MNITDMRHEGYFKPGERVEVNLATTGNEHQPAVFVERKVVELAGDLDVWFVIEHDGHQHTLTNIHRVRKICLHCGQRLMVDVAAAGMPWMHHNTRTGELYLQCEGMDTEATNAAAVRS